MSKLILFSFYKNLTLIYPQFIFGFFAAFAGMVSHFSLSLIGHLT